MGQYVLIIWNGWYGMGLGIWKGWDGAYAQLANPPNSLRVREFWKFLKKWAVLEFFKIWGRGMSFLHLMHGITHTHASTRASSLMHVKNSTCHFCL